jgi:hypothetical protein
VNLLLAHEDKTYSGAMIASLTIPWGDQKSDDELGGYHLVWTRDPVKSVTGLLAAGDTSTRPALSFILQCRIGKTVVLSELLAGRTTILDGYSVRRGCVSSAASVETLKAQRIGKLPSF